MFPPHLIERDSYVPWRMSADVLSPEVHQDGLRPQGHSEEQIVPKPILTTYLQKPILRIGSDVQGVVVLSCLGCVLFVSCLCLGCVTVVSWCYLGCVLVVSWP